MNTKLVLILMCAGLVNTAAWAQSAPEMKLHHGQAVTSLEQAPVSGIDLSGCWYGSWVSCKNGHNGRLSATFCRLDACHVRATFRGTFAKILPFRYPATLRIVSESADQMVLAGSQRLGPIMGSFEYQVTISGNRFFATYRSKRDWGQWTLYRAN